MEHVLYADILFFINFSMDMITLYLTSRLTSGPPLGWRTVVSALIGGLWGTLSIAVALDGVFGILLTGAISVLMVLVSFGYGGIGVLLRRSAVFWGTASLLGGVMTALCSFADSFGAPGYFRMAYCIDTEKVERSLVAMRKFVEETYPDR